MVFLMIELSTNDVVSNVPVLFWGKADDDVLLAASMQDFIIAAMGPEALHDPRGFRRAIVAAQERLDSLETPS